MSRSPRRAGGSRAEPLHVAENPGARVLARAALSAATASPTSAGKRMVLADDAVAVSGSGAAAPPNAMRTSGRAARSPAATDIAAVASAGMTAPITTARASVRSTAAIQSSSGRSAPR